MTTLFLIRHASNDYLKENRLAGLTPGIHLNAQGQQEADALAHRLAPITLHAIYSSPLERAVETARAIAQCQKLDVQIRPDLIEVDVGEWTGKSLNELGETEAWQRMAAQPIGFQFPGGEWIEQMQVRIVRAIDAIVMAHPKQSVAIVSHADPIKIALAYYLGMDPNRFNRLAIDPASVSVLVFAERGPVLVRLNDSGTLPSFQPEKKDA